MLTQLALMSIYQAPAVRLELVCEEYFGLSIDEAQRKAAKQDLPVPTFRLSSSRKAPLMVSCKDLAEHIDGARAAAARDWSAVRGAAPV